MVGNVKIEFQPVLPVFIIAAASAVVMTVLIVRLIRGNMQLRFRVASFVRLSLIVVLVFFVNLRPMMEVKDTRAMMKNLDVMFVTDTTVSMWAEDYGSGDTRWSGATEACSYIMDRLITSNFSLIRFNNVSQVLSPFTRDDIIITDALKTIKVPDKYYADGTNLNVPLKDMEALLESSDRKKGRKTIVFFISDGEITDKSKLSDDYRRLARYIDGGCVMGYGTKSGGKMKDSDGNTVYDFEKGRDARSRPDEKNLRSLADMLGIDYIRMGRVENIEFEVDKIIQMSSLMEGDAGTYSLEDLYYYPVYPLVLLLIWETALFIRKGRL